MSDVIVKVSTPPLVDVSVSPPVARGPMGPEGPEGPPGPTGLPGSPGAASTVPGPAGPAGATGARGPIGLTGPAGADSTVPGPTGPAGPAGPASTVPGPAGPTGLTGPVGPKGDTGLTGAASVVPGPAGTTGAKGDTGQTGPASTVPGPTGLQGPIGLTGATGAAGAKGDVGLTGPAGTTGAQGPIGLTGLTGPAGADSTVPGPAGPKGDTGPAGTGGALPPGGIIHQVLTKTSSVDGDADWETVFSAAPPSVPAAIPDLLFWWTGDGSLISAGKPLMWLMNSTPGLANLVGNALNGGVLKSAETLNGKPFFNFPNSVAGRYLLSVSCALHEVSAFFVMRPTAFPTGDQTLFGGDSGSLQVSVDATGVPHFNKAYTVNIGNATTPLAVGTWSQWNGTYNDSSGAFAYKVARAAAGNGTNLATISAYTKSIGYNSLNNAEDLDCDLAEIIVFNRVLTSSEIAAVEDYLFSKWGV